MNDLSFVITTPTTALSKTSVHHGEASSWVAREFGLTQQRVGQIVRQLGLKPRSIPWPEELVRQAQALRAEELTYSRLPSV